MSGKLPAFGDFSLPTDAMDLHEWMSDAFIDGDTGQDCTLVYPPKREECDNCIYDPEENRSSNIYKAGGPISFPNHSTCPRCQGRGTLNLEVTDSIRLRIYWEPSSWREAGMQVVDPTGMCMVIGYMNDLPKFERANSVKLHNALENIRDYQCTREGEAQPWGLRRNRFFVQMMKRLGGG